MATKTKQDRVTYQFETSGAAWSFMRACEAVKIAAGFPGLGRGERAFVGGSKVEGDLNAVTILVGTWMEREAADRLADGARVVGYEFGHTAARS